MKKIFILCLMLGVFYVVKSQTITIKDDETGEPIEGVSLMSESPHAFAVSDAHGHVSISDFEGSKIISIRSIVHEAVVKSYAELNKEPYTLELESTNINLEDVIISATRWNQKSGDVPSKVISISPKEIALQNPQTAADLLSVSGKVFVQKSQQGGGSPMIRGFATNRLLYTVDGVRMNTAIFRGGNIQNVISLDPFAIEHTEVLFGPGSVSYGSDAIGGVMSFQTFTPQLSLDNKPLIKGKATSRFSSANNEKTVHFDVNVGWKKWAMVSSFSSYDYGDLKMGSHGPDEYLNPYYVQRIDSVDVIITNEDPELQRPSGFTQMNMMQKIRFKPNEKWEFQYGLHYSETSDYARYDRHIRYKDGLPRYGEWSYGPQKWLMNNFSVSNMGDNAIYDQITLRLALQSFEESRMSRDLNKPEREVRIEEVEAYSANLDLVKTIGDKNTIFYGVEGVINDVTSTGIDENIETGISMPGASRYPQSTWASYGVYVSDQYKVSERFLFSGGLRYSTFQLEADFDTTFYEFPFTEANLSNSSLTGSIGFVFRPTKKWIIGSNLSTAFRAPNVDDVGKVFDSEPGAVVIPNPDLEAEYAYNADLSIAKVISKRVKIDVTGFYTQLQNALVRRNFQLNGQDSIVYAGELSQVQAIQNAAVANVYGVQAGLEIKLGKGFGFSTDFNYQLGEEELDDGTTSPSRHAAPWFGTSRLTYKTGKLNMQLNVQYSGEKSFDDLPESEKAKDFIYAIDENGNPYSPAWYSLNFKALYNLTNNFRVSAGLENITDQRYRPFSSGIVAPGRNMILSLIASF